MLEAIRASQLGGPKDALLSLTMGTFLLLPAADFLWADSGPLFSAAYAQVRAKTEHIRATAKLPQKLKIILIVLLAILGGLARAL